MEFVDIIIAPIFFLIILVVAMIIKKKFVHVGGQYFLPALALKLLSAIFIGVIYKFYYSGGDTYAYFLQGKSISNALSNDFYTGIKLMLSQGQFDPDTFIYSSNMYYYPFPPEFLIVKITGIFCFFGFNNYSVVAMYFAVFSFSGLWAMYKTWLKIFPQMHKYFAIAMFFIPSVFFWGSGILKDSVTLGAMGWLFSSFFHLVVLPKHLLKNIIILMVCIPIIYIIKIYLLLAFLPPLIFWVFLLYNRRIRSQRLKQLLLPLSVVVGFGISFLLFQNITQGSEKYNLNSIGERAKISADWLYYVSLKEGGSAYYLGDLDGSIESMINLSPKALFITLFRPFVWESKNLLMFLSSLEVFALTLFLIGAIFKNGIFTIFKKSLSDPFIFLCFSFTIIMAVGIGLTTYNFGSLVRYKIPLLPFYFAYIALLWKPSLRTFL